MRVINTQMFKNANLEPYQLFFVELWYDMTNRYSLDSYRVRCLNVHGIIKELLHELQVGLLNDKELKWLCDEALEHLNSDSVIRVGFSKLQRTVRDLLRKPPQGGNKGKTSRERSRECKTLEFVLRDFAVALDKDYLSRLAEALPTAMRPENEEELRQIVAALLSELVSRGWSMTSLWSWHRHFLAENAAPGQSFDERIKFMLRRVQQGPETFRVTLRLSGSQNLATIKKFHELDLNDSVDIATVNQDKLNKQQLERFAQASSYTTFATTSVDALDRESAAMAGRARVESLLDLFRFDYEARVIKLEPWCLVCRERDGRAYLLEIQHTVPNPARTNDFDGLAGQVDRLLEKDCIDPVSRMRLSAALRQYRFGSDSQSYPDKFMAWWMGLEVLARSEGERSIGDAVTNNVSSGLLADYLRRLLLDFTETLQHSGISWPTELNDIAGCRPAEQLTLPVMLRILRDPCGAKTLWERYAEHPLVVYRGKHLQQVLSDSKMLAKQLEIHRNHLQWHLARLYRIRCCIVHGSPVIFDLPLYAANLEFYLKEIIRLALRILTQHDHIKNVDELFYRAAQRNALVQNLLTTSNVPVDAVQEAVLMDLVAQAQGQAVAV